jgi:hypothetical protein
MEGNQVDLNKPIYLNSSQISLLIEAHTDPDNLIQIVENEGVIQTILQHYILIETIPPDSDIDFDRLRSHLKTGGDFFVDAETIKTLNDLLQTLEVYRAINKKCTRLKKQFHEKLTEEFSNPTQHIWKTLSNWIDESYDCFLDFKSILSDSLKTKMNQWINVLKKDVSSYLEKELKDYLYSEVNKKIILGKIKNDKEWKQTLLNTEGNKHNPLRKLEIAIKDNIQELVKPIKAPFIAEFSKELYSSCYKQLLHNQKEEALESAVNVKRGDITLKQIRDIKVSETLSSQFKDQYIKLLEYVLDNKTNIKDYANQNLNILTELSVNSELNLLQKMDIKKNYQILYFNIRKLEKEQIYWEKRIDDSASLPIHDQIKLVCSCLESLYHRRHPFLMTYFSEVKDEMNSPFLNQRKTMILKYKETLERLKYINKYQVYLQRINKELLNPSRLFLLSNNFTVNFNDCLVYAKSIWLKYDWYLFLEEVCNMLDISILPVDSQKRDILPGIEPENSTVSVTTKNIQGDLPEYHQLC